MEFIKRNEEKMYISIMQEHEWRKNAQIMLL